MASGEKARSAPTYSQSDDAALKMFALSVVIAGNIIEMKREIDYIGFNVFAALHQVRLIESDRTILNQDMTYLLLLVNNRGTNFKKAMARMSEEGQTKIKALVKKYGLLKSTKDKDASKLSLGRLAACFPHITMKLCADGHMRDLVPGDELPRHFKFLQAPSLFSDNTYEEQWKTWARAANKILNPKAKEEDIKTSVESYYKIMYTSPLFTIDERVALQTAIKELEEKPAAEEQPQQQIGVVQTSGSESDAQLTEEENKKRREEHGRKFEETLKEREKIMDMEITYLDTVDSGFSQISIKTPGTDETEIWNLSPESLNNLRLILNPRQYANVLKWNKKESANRQKAKKDSERKTD